MAVLKKFFEHNKVKNQSIKTKVNNKSLKIKYKNQLNSVAKFRAFKPEKDEQERTTDFYL